MPQSIVSRNEIPSNEKSNCLYSVRRMFTAADIENPFLYHVTFAGHYAATDGYIIRRIGLDSLLLLYTAEGEGVVSVNGGAEITLGPNSVLILDCRCQHIYHTVKAPWNFYYLHLSGNNCMAFATYMKCRDEPVRILSESSGAKLTDFINNILAMPEEISASLDLQISSVVYGIMMLLLDKRNGIPDTGNSTHSLQLRELESYMDTHIAEALDTERLASMLYMTRPYFSAVFHRIYGIPPHRYLTVKRIDRAKQLLSETNDRIDLIAAKVGFSNASAFSRCFFRITGMTPRRYRELD